MAPTSQLARVGWSGGFSAPNWDSPPSLRGLGDAQKAQYSKLATSTAASVVAKLGAAKALGLTVASASVVGLALVGVGIALEMIFNRKGPQQKVQATLIADETAQVLQDNMDLYLSDPNRTEAMRDAAIANFHEAWGRLVELCNDPRLGDPGQRCINERKRGGIAPWCDKPGQKGCDWFALYLDPILNDTGAQQDAMLSQSTGVPDGGSSTSSNGGSSQLYLGIGLVVAGVFLYLGEWRMNLHLRPVGVNLVPNRALLRMRYGMGELPYLDCTADIYSAASSACVDENLRRQQINFAERNSDQRQILLDNCNRDWALNDAVYKSMNLPRPVNTCAERSFGITPAGGYTGSQVETQIPVTYIPAAPPPPPDNSVQLAAAAKAKAEADALAAKAAADAAAKKAAADPTNPAAQAAAEKAKADAAAANTNWQNSQDPNKLALETIPTWVWVAGAVVVGGLAFAAVNR